MKSVSFRKDLVGVQDELLRFAYKLTTDREEANDLLQETSLKALDNEDKYMPDTNFKGWMYTIMRNIFINNYRKVVRDQTFIDRTDNLYHLNLPQDTGFESTEKARYETFCETLKFIYGEDFKNIMPNWSNDASKEFYSRK